MRLLHIAASVLGVALLSGCASPLVKYQKITGDDLSGVRKFKFSESVIKFDYAKNEVGKPSEDIVIASVPHAAGPDVYGLSGTSGWENWGVDTSLATSMRADGYLIQDVTVAVTDQRKAIIEGVGSAVAGVLAMVSTQAVAPAGRAKLPDGVDMATFLTEIETNQQPKCGQSTRDGMIKCQDLTFEDNNDEFKMNLLIAARPVDAVELAKLNWKDGFKTNSYFYSACREATVTLIRKDKSVAARLDTVIADPKWVSTLRFPDKGKVTAGASCGAASTPEDAKLPTGMDYVNSLIAQAAAIKKAHSGSGAK